MDRTRTTTTAIAATKQLSSSCVGARRTFGCASTFLGQDASHAGMRHWMLLLVVPFLALAGCKRHPSPALHSGDGSVARVRSDASALAHQQAALLNVATTDMDTDVPAAAQRAIPPFQGALVQLVDDVMAGQGVGATAARVQAAVKAELPTGKAPDDAKERAAAKAAGKDDLDVPTKGNFGGGVGVTVSSVNPGMLLVNLSFGVMCGDDNLVLVYSNAGGRWRRVLRWQAAPYKQVSGAFGDMLLTRVLPPRRNGHPVLLVVHGTPWCTSTESMFSMDAFELDPSVATEKPFWHGSHDYRRADDTIGFGLIDEPDGFEVKTSVDDHVGDSINRVGVLRYALDGNTIRRRLPIAMNSRETVSEWLSIPRDEATLFTDAPPGSSTWQMWDALTFEGKSTDEAMKVPTITYGEVRTCSDAKHYQVALHTETERKSTTPARDYYVQVQETGNGYRLRDTLAQPDPGCTGKVVALKSSGDVAGWQ